MKFQYKRVLLKCSGELFGKDDGGSDISFKKMQSVASEISDLFEMDVEICLVVGGGNIFRGRMAEVCGIPRYTGDYMGMLATTINALAMQHALDEVGLQTRVMSSISMPAICEPYIRKRAQRHLQKGRVVVFAAGTGNPYFSTDTAASLRAAEMQCDVILKGTSVDGVYSQDPNKDANAERYKDMSYKEVLTQDLQVMDAAAISLAKENDIPIIVFDIYKQGNLLKVLQGDGTFTLISG